MFTTDFLIGFSRRLLCDTPGYLQVNLVFFAFHRAHLLLSDYIVLAGNHIVVSHYFLAVVYAANLRGSALT